MEIMPRNKKFFDKAREEMSRIPELEFIDPELAMTILKSIPNKQYNNGQVIGTLKFVLLALLQRRFSRDGKIWRKTVRSKQDENV